MQDEHTERRQAREHENRPRAAGQIADDDECERVDGYLSGIPYAEIQLLTVAQSRFSKNASMYAARSVR